MIMILKNQRKLGHTIVAGMLPLVLLLLGGCGATTDRDGGEPGVSVVATTTVLGDVARNVVGNAGTVEVLLPVGADPHDYQASAQQVAAIERADLVVANGLGLEEGLRDVLTAAAGDGSQVLYLADQLDPLPLRTATDTQHEEGGEDPHVWLDPIRMADGAVVLASELEAILPGGGYAARGEAYAAQLTSTDAEIRDILSSVPETRRKIVTNHDALGYFAARYGLEVIGTVIPGGSTLADPSSSELSALIAAIEAAGVTAIFAETTEGTALAEAVAAEVGYRVDVVELYTGSLGEAGSGADTLIGLLRTDAGLIEEALS
jgi:zinc/manganese transport system substrate-binding protein